MAGVAVGLLELAHAECAARLAELGLRPERGARGGRRTVRVANPELDGLARVCPERTLHGLAAEQVELLALDRVDLVPGTRSADAAGESGSTTPILTPSAGVARSAMRKKIAKARTMFMTTPATRIARRARSGWAANERGSSAASPSSPSSRTKPPIGSQFRVHRVSPFDRRTLARGGKPMPNSRTRTLSACAVR